MKYVCNYFFLPSFVLLLSVCSSGVGDDIKTANVYFTNHTSYQVDIYKNGRSPDYLICAINPGSTKMVEQYPSYDQEIGDTFYPHYKIRLASIPDVIENIDIDAQRLMTNLTFVIEGGERYDKSIPQPQKGELSFFHGYIEVQNQGTSQIRIIRGGSPLPRLDNGSLYIDPGQILGFFEINFSSYDTTVNMNQLRAFGNDYYNFPEFTAERGKLYRFIFKDNAVAWNEPDVVNLDPLNK